MSYRSNDSTKGWSGSGIDQEDGQKWFSRQVDKKALKDAGFIDLDKGYTPATKIDCDYEESGNVLKAAKSATGNFNPDYGKGRPNTKSQSGFGDED